MELPRLEPLWLKYRDKGFSIVAVEARRDTQEAIAFIEENKLTYTFLENGVEDAEVVSNIFDIFAFPSTFVIDRQGRIQFFHLGFEAGDEEKIEEEINTLLQG